MVLGKRPKLLPSSSISVLVLDQVGARESWSVRLKSGRGVLLPKVFLMIPIVLVEKLYKCGVE
jgi:hypothetical protein